MTTTVMLDFTARPCPQRYALDTDAETIDHAPECSLHVPEPAVIYPDAEIDCPACGAGAKAEQHSDECSKCQAWDAYIDHCHEQYGLYLRRGAKRAQVRIDYPLAVLLPGTPPQPYTVQPGMYAAEACDDLDHCVDLKELAGFNVYDHNAPGHNELWWRLTDPTQSGFHYMAHTYVSDAQVSLSGTWSDRPMTSSGITSV